METRPSSSLPSGGYGWTTVDDRLTRGGPAALTPAAYQSNIFVQTNQNKPVNLGVGAFYSRDAAGTWFSNLNSQIAVRASSALSLSLTPNYSSGRSAAQYVQQVRDSIRQPERWRWPTPDARIRTS